MDKRPAFRVLQSVVLGSGAKRLATLEPWLVDDHAAFMRVTAEIDRAELADWCVCYSSRFESGAS
jgi:hypothetical protein